MKGGLTRKQLQQSLSGLSGKKRMDALIELEDAKGAIRMLPVEDLYATVLEVGLDDALDLVQLASPAQFRGLVDLGSWKKDELQPHEVLTWIRAARGEELEDFLVKLQALDIEILELLVRSFVEIHDLEENPDVNPTGVTMESPEGKYLLEFKVEGIEQATLRQLLMDIIARDPFQAGRLFEAIRWEMPSEMEEVAYRFRSARLQDLGFPPLEEAMSLYSASRVPRPAAASGPGLVRDTGHVDYLQAGLTGLDDDEREKVDQELRYLFNQALVADGADPGDLPAFRAVAERARDTLNLGLEQLAGGVISKAADVLREHPPKRAFQVGFGLTLDLKFAADRLFKDSRISVLGTTLLLEEEQRFVEALRKKRPMKALRTPGAEAVPFRSHRELAEAAVLLERSRAQAEILGGLLGPDDAAASAVANRFGAGLSQLGAERLFISAVANALLDGKAEPGPLAAARLPGLLELMFSAEAGTARLREGVVDRATAAFASSSNPEVRRMVERAVARIGEEAGRPWAQGGVVDPKHVWALPIEGQPLL